MADLEQAAVWHRQIAALVAAADRAGVAPDDLPAFRARLAAQVFEFTQVASLAGVPLPALQPTASEIAAVSPALGDLGDAAAAQLLRTASATLDAAEAVLRGSPTSVVQTAPGQQSTGPYATFTPQSTGLAEGPPPPVPPTVPLQAKPTDPVGLIAAPAPPEQAARRAKGIEMWRPGARNGAVYGSCALFVAIIQVVLFFSVNETLLTYLSWVCVLLLPAFSWAAGWLLIGFLFEPAPGTTLNRTPKLGAVIAAAPDLLACAGFAVLIIKGISS